MAFRVLRLRLALILAPFQSGGRRAGRAVAALIVAALLASAAWTLPAVLSGLGPAQTQTVLVVLGAAVTACAVLVPAILRVEDQLDPRRLRGILANDGAAPFLLLLGGIASGPVLWGLVAVIPFVVIWLRLGAPWPAVLLSAVLGLATGVLAGRIVAVLRAPARPRGAAARTAGLVLLLLVVGIAATAAGLSGSVLLERPLRIVSTVLSYTPLGAGWAIAGADTGAPMALAVVVAVALATIALLLLCWVGLVRRALRPERPPRTRRDGLVGGALFAGGGALVAISSRSMRYWFRDRRYLANLVVVPVAGVLVALPLLVVGVSAPVTLFVSVSVMALLFGWLPHNDLAYDSSAIWLHLSSGVPGWTDRLGRLLPVVVIAVPVLAVVIGVAAADQEPVVAALPALIGSCASLLLCALGLSSLSSALMPYPVAQPGDGPFHQPQGSMSRGMPAQIMVLAGAVLLSVPALALSAVDLFTELGAGWIALATGLVIGIAVLVVGVVAGGRAFERRRPKVMEFAEAL